MTARKLRHYFAVHPVIVVDEAPFSNMLNNLEAMGCVSLWEIEISPLDITYEKKEGNQVANSAIFHCRVA
jgi:hypothetical protein